MSTLHRCDGPPERGPELFVRRLKANEEVSAVILGHKIEGFMSHWSGEHSMKCTTPVEECLGHQAGYPLRWRGYLHVLPQPTGTDYFLEITEGAAKQFKAMLEVTSSWRGMRIGVKRLNGNATRLKIQVHAHWSQLSQKPLPPAKDPEESLEYLYSYVGKTGRKKRPTDVD